MPAELVTVVAVFISTALLVGTVASAVLRQYAPERKRLREMVRPAGSTVALPQRLAFSDRPNTTAQRICRLLPRSQARMTEMRQKLVAAGYRSPAAPVAYAASQIVSSIVTGAVLMLLTGKPPFGFLGMAIGFGLPTAWLSRQCARRARVLRDGLADVLDLLIVCLESGLGLDQAILRCSEELGIAYRALADELALVVAEVRAGTTRAEALQRFAERTRVDEIRSLATLLIQTDRYGTGVAQALRVEADLLRTRRHQRAEERAGKANVKLVIPLVLCLFPAFYILTLGPALLRVARMFSSLMAETQ